MTLVKTNTRNTDGMHYTPTPVTQPDNARIARKALKNLVNKQPTILALWYIIVKHKKHLFVASWAILVINTIDHSWLHQIASIVR